MKIGGLEFPYDHERDVGTLGSIGGFIARLHPLAMWIPACVIGVIVGYVFHTPGHFP